MDSTTQWVLNGTDKVVFSVMRRLLTYGHDSGAIKSLGNNTYIVDGINQAPVESTVENRLREDPLPAEWARNSAESMACSNIIVYHHGIPLMEFFANGVVIIYMLNGFWCEAEANRINMLTKGHGIHATGARSQTGQSRIRFSTGEIFASKLAFEGASGIKYNPNNGADPTLFMGAPPLASFGRDFTGILQSDDMRPMSIDVWVNRMRLLYTTHLNTCFDNGIASNYKRPRFIDMPFPRTTTPMPSTIPSMPRRSDSALFARVKKYVTNMMVSIEEEGGLYRATMPPSIKLRRSDICSRKMVNRLLSTNVFPRQIYVDAVGKYPSGVILRDPSQTREYRPQQRRPGTTLNITPIKFEEEKHASLSKSLERGLCNILLINHPDFPEDGKVSEGAESPLGVDLESLDGFRIEAMNENSAVISFVTES